MAVNGNVVVLQTSFETSQLLTQTMLGTRYDQEGLEGVFGQRIVTATLKRVDTLSRDENNIFQLDSYQEYSLEERLWSVLPQKIPVEHPAPPVVHQVAQLPMPQPCTPSAIHLIVHGRDDCDPLPGRSMEVRRVQIFVITDAAEETLSFIRNRQTSAKHSGDLRTGALFLKAVFLSESTIFLSDDSGAGGGIRYALP